MNARKQPLAYDRIWCMGIKRTRHAVYDIKYHFVWVPKYRKEIMEGEVGRRVKLFEEFPWLRQKIYWGGEFWNDGYFVRTVGDNVTADVIRKYIEYQHDVETKQLDLF